MNILQRRIEENGTLILDGATGTELFKRGLESGDPPEMWNIEHKDRVIDMHRCYIEAGSDVILTNSFGGTHFRLKLHKLQDRVVEINRAAAEVAREAVAEAGRPVLVAGSIGPTGELLRPMGNMSYEQAVEAFAEQARGLIEGGVDLLWIETMSDLDEVKAAYEGGRQVSADIPICATMSFDTSARTMMGVSAAAAVEALSQLDLTAIGANCGNNMPDTENVMITMRELNPDILLIVKSNAGMPQWVGEDLVYDGTPEVMGGYAHRMREVGVQLIGGCCGSTPEHIHLMKQVVSDAIPVPEAMPTQEATIVNLQMVGRKRRKRRRG